MDQQDWKRLKPEQRDRYKRLHRVDADLQRFKQCAQRRNLTSAETALIRTLGEERAKLLRGLPIDWSIVNQNAAPAPPRNHFVNQRVSIVGGGLPGTRRHAS